MQKWRGEEGGGCNLLVGLLDPKGDGGDVTRPVSVTEVRRVVVNVHGAGLHIDCPAGPWSRTVHSFLRSELVC